MDLASLKALGDRIDLSNFMVPAGVIFGYATEDDHSQFPTKKGFYFQVWMTVKERDDARNLPQFPSETQHIGADWDDLKILRAICAELCAFSAHEVLESFRVDGKLIFDPHRGQGPYTGEDNERA